VLVYQTETLREPLRIAGQPIRESVRVDQRHDADWVVKIIDVWPDEVQEQPDDGRLSADVVGGHFPRPLTGPTSPSRKR
jgi:predicted acyl esterase